MSKSRKLYRVFNDVMIMISKRYDATVVYKVSCVVRRRQNPIMWPLPQLVAMARPVVCAVSGCCS